ncbi:MAG: hypothetical protein U0074_08420 [Kouleothrix sp.]
MARVSGWRRKVSPTNGQNLEGVGVQPDILLDIDWTHYSEDDDPQLLEALRQLGGGPNN